MKTHNKDIIRFSRNYCCIKLRHNQNLKIHKKTVSKEGESKSKSKEVKSLNTNIGSVVLSTVVPGEKPQVGENNSPLEENVVAEVKSTNNATTSVIRCSDNVPKKTKNFQERTFKIPLPVAISNTVDATRDSVSEYEDFFGIEFNTNIEVSNLNIDLSESEKEEQDRDGTFKIHDRTNGREKPCSYSLCEKSFHRVDYLETHERKHSGENPYSCSNLYLFRNSGKVRLGQIRSDYVGLCQIMSDYVRLCQNMSDYDRL